MNGWFRWLDKKDDGWIEKLDGKMNRKRDGWLDEWIEQNRWMVREKNMDG